ncbi:MAG: hypothetical protein Q8K14_15805 [Hydrogenophaga sp.]|uniref:hypothetical protein n=1 Tax=Hydrogenophaga sp. TaxID=1904254 RepID=UPI0027307704|nr:hypothetical protein [Hydrogenophaga sp.]MDP1781569.1 hypothetical protein [Hydrogenophaga sp.]MDP2251883.1 hypothetical protein [Hydrogenophaga sp.]
MPQTTAQSAAQNATTFVDLTPDDVPAIVVHLQALDEADQVLRFGTPVKDAEHAERIARRLLQINSVFGLWDAAHVRLLMLGSYGKATLASDAIETASSALPEARGGMSQRMANWLYPRLVAQGHKRIEWNFYADNAVVRAIAKKRGMKVDCRQGECVAYFDLQPTADAIRDWLDSLDQLLEAVRNASHAGPGARL